MPAALVRYSNEASDSAPGASISGRDPPATRPAVPGGPKSSDSVTVCGRTP